MAYAINVRVPVKGYLPEELKAPGKVFINVCAYSSKMIAPGSDVILSENCKEAHVYSISKTKRPPSSFDFNLG